MFQFAWLTSVVAVSAAASLLPPLLKTDAYLAATLNKERPMENPQLFQGDILRAIGNSAYTALTNDADLWPNGRVPYIIDPSLQGVSHLIRHAMQEYHQKTCIRFVPYDGTQQNYVRIFRGQGCYANVGMVGGEQPLSLGIGCHFLGTAVHELGHVLGFYHEHTRHDRDDFIDLFFRAANVDPSYYPQFEKLEPHENRLFNRFDYDSVMLYGSKAFSKNGQNTMMKKNGETLVEVHEKDGLSQSDIERVQRLYRCRYPTSGEQPQNPGTITTELSTANPTWIFNEWYPAWSQIPSYKVRSSP